MYFTNKESYNEYNENIRLLESSIEDYFKELSKKDTNGFIKLFNEIMFLDEKYEEIITEGKLRQVADKVKIANKRMDQKVDGTTDPMIKSVKTAIIGQTREEIIENHTKVSKLIKRCLGGGALFLISPTIAIIGLFIGAVLKQNLKTKERERILADLKRELEICEEKIRDADSSGDKKQKYELMRLKNELKRSIERVRHPALTNA